MKYHKQKFLHDPDNGIWGDCWRTVIACLLDKDDPEDVPHFMDNGGSEKPREDVRKYLLSQGFMVLYHYLSFGEGEEGVRQVLEYMEYCNPDTLYMLSGTSRNGTQHVVICLNDKIIHDPARDESGIIGPGESGGFWVEQLVPLSKQYFFPERIQPFVAPGSYEAVTYDILSVLPDYPVKFVYLKENGWLTQYSEDGIREALWNMADDGLIDFTEKWEIIKNG